ncbi:hypothetical protein [Nitratifractor sp.]
MPSIRFLLPILPLLLPLSLSAADTDPSCRGCGAGKLMLQCDVYVARQGDLSRQPLCERYARIVDIDGASAKASWYYLLAGKPAEALRAADRAIELGQSFAYEYAAFARLLLGQEGKAEAAMRTFLTKVPDPSYVRRDLKSLKRVYPKVPFGKLLDK